MRFRLIFVAVAAILITGIGLAPAQALPAVPVISEVDASTPGKVSGSVSADTPYVRVFNEVDDAMIDTSSGVGTFELETWGLTSTNYLFASACPDDSPDIGECSDDVNAQFTATDVRPEVAWPTDPTVGAGQAVEVTVSDPQGGGELRAYWGWNWQSRAIDRNGTTVLDFPEGRHDLRIRRCSVGGQRCADFSPALLTDVEVRTTTKAEVGPHGTAAFNGAISTQQPTVMRAIRTFRNEAHPYTFDWHLEQDGVPVAGSEESQTGTLGATGAFQITVDGAGLGDGTYVVKGTLKVHHPDFGDLTGLTTSTAPVVVDRTPPQFASASQSTRKIFPFVGAYGYRKAVTFYWTGNDGGADVVIRNSAGVDVSKARMDWVHSDPSTKKAYWDGRDFARHIMPAGTYSAFLRDAAGNVGPSLGWVTLSRKKLVTKTFVRTVQASGSTVSKYVGRCSQLRRPVRNWVGSQGYYANTRCGTQTASASEVNTVHQIRLPAALDYVSLHVTTYGGPATSKPGSRASLVYLATTRHWYHQWEPRAWVGNHVAPDVNPDRYVWSDRYFVWGFATAYGHRYDVKNFTVVVKYRVLG